MWEILFLISVIALNPPQRSLLGPSNQHMMQVLSRRAAAMHLAEKEDMWLTLPQQIQFSQHLETATKAGTYILWGEKPSPQRKAYVATVLGLPLPLESNDPFF
jgi:hypothetical protein